MYTRASKEGGGLVTFDENYPVYIDIKDKRSVTIVSKRADKNYFFNKFILEAAYKHHYDDINIAIYCKNQNIFNMFYKLKLLNSYWVCLAYSSITLPAATWIMVAHFKKIPLALEEAAHMDGCSTWQTLWKVIFPVALPGVFTCAIMTFISAWNEYLLTYTLNADKAFQTVPVGINALRTQFAILWGEITAATIVVVIPTLIIVLLFQKQIVSGMVSGAVKE